MSGQFERRGPNVAKSSLGFSVWTAGSSGVVHEDERGQIRIGSEWLTEGPVQIVLYTRPPNDPAFERLVPEQRREVLQRVIDALEFLGHKVVVE